MRGDRSDARACTGHGIAAAACLAGMSLFGFQRGGASAAPPNSPTGATVKLVRATKECFSDTIYVTAILVPRQEAVVILGERSRVTDVLAAEGDQAQLARAQANRCRAGVARNDRTAESLAGGPLAPRMPVPLGKLNEKLLQTGRQHGDDPLPLALRHLCLLVASALE
jgi:hypothetical protein